MVSECKLFATKAKLESLKLQDYGTLPLLLEVLTSLAVWHLFHDNCIDSINVNSICLVNCFSRMLAGILNWKPTGITALIFYQEF